MSGKYLRIRITTHGKNQIKSLLLNSKDYIEITTKKKGVIYDGIYYKAGYPSLVNSAYDGKDKGIGKTLHIVENTFKELGYYFTWEILNTKEHGVPQNRERIYIVGFRKAKDFKKFKFQKPIELKTRLMDILEDEVDEKYLLSNKLVKCYENRKDISKSYEFKPLNLNNKKDRDRVANCLTVKYGNYSTDTYLKVNYNEASSIRMVGRRLNEEGKRDDYNLNISTKQQLEFREDGVANCITCVQKDSMVLVKKKLINNSLLWFTPIEYADYLITNKNVTNNDLKRKLYNDLIEVSEGEIRVKEAVKKGFSVASLGDSINLSVPSSKTRRGRVGNGVAQTLDTACNQVVVSNNIKMEQTHYLDINANDSNKRIYNADGCSPTLTTMGGGHREPKVAIDNNHKDFIFRKLTPRECFRLQGFGDDFKFNVSDTQAYKQAGNSMSANITGMLLDDICKILNIQKVDSVA